MKKAKKIIAFVLVLVMAAALLSGCGETGQHRQYRKRQDI